MYKFGISLRLGKMLFLVSRLKPSIWIRFLKYGTGFGKFSVVVGELDLES